MDGIGIWKTQDRSGSCLLREEGEPALVNTALNIVLADAATWGERPFRSSFERFAARVVSL